jgi:hypothetical protein
MVPITCNPLLISRKETETSVSAVWTYSCPCSNRPKGEQRIAQAAFATLRRARRLHSVRPGESAATKALRSRAFRPGKAYGKKIALKGRPTFGRYPQKGNLRQTRLDGISRTRESLPGVSDSEVLGETVNRLHASVSFETRGPAPEQMVRIARCLLLWKNGFSVKYGSANRRLAELV